MVRLLFIFLLFSSCTKGQMFATYSVTPVAPVTPPTPPDFSVLINNGTFSPSTTLTSYVNKYQNFHKGWLIDFQMNTFFGSYVNALAAVTAPDPSRFDVHDVDVSRWLDSAQSNSIDYLVLNVINEYGFKLWRSRTPYLMSTVNLGSTGYQSPAYNDYSVPLTSDTAIVWDFVNGCRARGIEPVAYVNSLNDYNVLHGYIPSNTSANAARQTAWINYMCRLMQELIIVYGFKYIWIDYAAPLPAGLSQSFYNAVKSADPTCQVIGNVLGETNFSRYPYDIESTEEHVITSGNTAYQTTSRTYLGTTYYVGQEIVATPYGSMSQWYYYDSQVKYLPTVNPFTSNPPWTNLTETSAASFQTLLVDKSKQYAKPLLACMLADRNGVLYAPNMTYLRNLNWTR